MDKLKNFIASIGIMCETWTVVYKSFVNQGMEAKEAMAHTQGFMTAFITSTLQNNGGKE